MTVTEWLDERGVRIGLEFKPNDLWVGLFTRRQQVCGMRLPHRALYCTAPAGHPIPFSTVSQHDWEHEAWGAPRQQADAWICFVPMLPLRITVRR